MTRTAKTTRTMTTTIPQKMSASVMQRQLLIVDNLRDRVHRILKCVINLHIEFLVLESNVNELLDEVKAINQDLLDVQRLDDLINTLRDYNGPTICHEWPYPLIFKGTIDKADMAQMPLEECRAAFEDAT